jgi:hypothetical protein
LRRTSRCIKVCDIWTLYSFAPCRSPHKYEKKMRALLYHVAMSSECFSGTGTSRSRWEFREGDKFSQSINAYLDSHQTRRRVACRAVGVCAKKKRRRCVRAVSSREAEWENQTSSRLPATSAFINITLLSMLASLMLTHLLQHFTVGSSAEHVFFKWVEHLVFLWATQIRKRSSRAP